MSDYDPIGVIEMRARREHSAPVKTVFITRNSFVNTQVLTSDTHKAVVASGDWIFVTTTPRGVMVYEEK